MNFFGAIMINLKIFKQLFLIFISFLSIISACTKIVEPTFNGPNIQEHNIIILSTHPDDAVLTFGGMIQNNEGFQDQNKIITIYEPFGMTNYTVDGGFENYTNDRISDVTSLRLKEDYKAYNRLFNGWGQYAFNGKLYPEMTLRHYLANKALDLIPQGEEVSVLQGLNVDVIQYTHEDLVYYDKIYHDLLFLLNQKDCAVFAQGGVGNPRFIPHPDHILLREAVIQAAHDLAQKKPLTEICQIYFGEDQPYTNGDLAGSISNIAAFRKRLGNIESKYVIEYKIDKEKKLKLFKDSYKSQNGSSYLFALLKRDDERVYLWPKNRYAKVTTNIKILQHRKKTEKS